MGRAKYDLKLSPETALEKRVARMMREGACGESLRSHVRDVCEHGCQSGVVSDMIATRDCLRFYERYRLQILRNLQDMMDDVGVTSPAELFGAKFDANDIFLQDEPNQVLVSWWAVEETARTLASRAGYDL